ncbi:MAG: tRNA (adenosine(37)-N6)-threonylcarbamoyltransferase complex dimerization subunit type 1 TsaB [Candidatus Saccharimonadales bacterium]
MSNTNKLILTIRTEKPEAELGLYSDGRRIAYYSWHAHRELAETIHAKLQELIASTGSSLQDVTAIACYKGPGSFTGLRIGISVANALAYGLSVPIVSTTGEDWIEQCSSKLEQGESDFPVQPFYGAPVHITAQKK